jgi:HTH-type transcriptional regulator, sugar sensing transcriptional regulator
MKLEKVLANFGLTEKQAQVYLACLELGSAPVNDIARKAQVARSTCYDLLETLRNQGIASTFIKKKTRYYSVEDPQKLVSLARDRATNLSESLPQLEALYGLARERPKVRFYQGKAGMKLILEEILADKPKEILNFGSAEELFITLQDYFPKFVAKRIKAKILARVILRDSPKARERQKLGPQQLRVVKIISKEFKHQGMVMVWRNKIAYFSFTKDYIAVVIESKELADIQQSMFEYMWQQTS